MTMNNIHEKHWSEFMADAHHKSLYESWWTSESVGFWRQTRLLVIEPQDPWVDFPCAVDETRPMYESVGNFVYQFSTRELEKIAYGLNIRGIASKIMMDAYIPGCETAVCVDGDPIWEQTRSKVDDLSHKLQTGATTASYIQGAFFKHTVAAELFDMLKQQNPSWRFLRTDGNPYLDGKPAF